MLTFFVAPGHNYTLRALERGPLAKEGVQCRAVDYHTAFLASVFPLSTYIFCDFERLYPWELALAGALHRSMQTEGCNALNDPARGMAKYQLLRTLHSAGVNTFTTYRADDDPKPKRFPVFIRGECDHGAIVNDLIQNARELEQALAGLQSRGISLRGLLVTEYAAEPIAPSVFRKYSCYRIGDAYLLDRLAHDERWAVKYGVNSPHYHQYHPEEYAIVLENHINEAVRASFAAANLEYGRADFGLVQGRPQIYEINTNPDWGTPDIDDVAPTRRKTVNLIWERRLDALSRLDIHRGETKSVTIDSRPLQIYRDSRVGPDGGLILPRRP